MEPQVQPQPTEEEQVSTPEDLGALDQQETPAATPSDEPDEVVQPSREPVPSGAGEDLVAKMHVEMEAIRAEQQRLNQENDQLRRFQGMQAQPQPPQPDFDPHGQMAKFIDQLDMAELYDSDPAKARGFLKKLISQSHDAAVQTVGALYARQMADQQRAQAIFQSYHTKYPEHRKHLPLVEVAASQVERENPGVPKHLLIEAVGKRTESLIKQYVSKPSQATGPKKGPKFGEGGAVRGKPTTKSKLQKELDELDVDE